MPIDLARRARRSGLDVRIDGCDISPVAVDFRRSGGEDAGIPVRFFRLDALNEPLPEDYDVVMCSLFLHHLADDEAVRLLRKMADAARSLILVNDLLRSRLGYWLAWAGCRLLSRSPIVHHDGPASVRAAFRLARRANLAERAGLDGARVDAPLAAAVPPLLESRAIRDAAERKDGHDRLPWDAIVIGAGPAGAMAARELARRRGARPARREAAISRARRSAADASTARPWRPGLRRAGDVAEAVGRRATADVPAGRAAAASPARPAGRDGGLPRPGSMRSWSARPSRPG